jgi:hypothetical protein
MQSFCADKEYEHIMTRDGQGIRSARYCSRGYALFHEWKDRTETNSSDILPVPFSRPFPKVKNPKKMPVGINFAVFRLCG